MLDPFAIATRGLFPVPDPLSVATRGLLGLAPPPPAPTIQIPAGTLAILEFPSTEILVMTAQNNVSIIQRSTVLEPLQNSTSVSWSHVAFELLPNL